ncbi:MULTISPECIES: hypothetical protein [unclassified Ensifer]|uniref:hypothetical protein n=1 Tax=unclassified Ensifer TaxID=2633371 RepID=UPI000812CC95|nr:MULTISPECIES: hypothetical protein [unclassified Ensifer]OCP07990.1 hypothetical protein BC362_10290 [Ensifer sp. LC14]OCP10900.1 hypothetical protein BC374_17675 [Ensifer sp. LC13]OCP11554.1 hypothetical protein BBX50_18180 [Ensifer sp. LC11]OCP33373.1 hypothetical protein BC364_17070 [Ensifer sp. LC499]
MTTETVLDLVELGIVPQSARALGQTLTPIANGSRRRLANGELVSRKRVSFEKFASTISFSDTYAPAFGDLWAGETITVYCVCEINEKVGRPFQRPPVPGSVIYRDAGGKVVPHGSDETVAPVGALWRTYRPIIVFMVDGWDMDTDEYAAVVSSTLNLFEA